MLDDKTIRSALISMLERKAQKPKLIVEELGVHNGNAIVDVVAVYKALHGFEIKGETDNVSRVAKQSVFYNVSLPKLTLVTTQNHLGWALRNLPEYWGVILATKGMDGVVRLSHKRPAMHNPSFSKATSLLMLWKAELLGPQFQRHEPIVRKSDSRAELATKIAASFTKDQIAALLAVTINDRENTKEPLGQK